MDTLSLMQQLIPHLQAQAQSAQTSIQSAATSSNGMYPTPNVFTQRPMMSTAQHPQFGFVKISPTTAVVDVNTGFPTAAVAETPTNFMAFMSGSNEAALPPETASTSMALTSSTASASGMPATASSAPNIVNYMAAVQAAAALQSDAMHSAFRTPFPAHPSPSSSSNNNTTTTSDSFLTIALNTLVSPGDNCPENSKEDSRSGTSDAGRTGLLCQVCSDTASGFHYGVFACEGCKGFFRRSIQQKINYRPCSKSQQCAIVRNNRNRCQYCRLKKCISVGMSRDAVRFGRVPKREKVKMVEEMQRASARSLRDSMMVELEDEQALAAAVDWGFQELGEALRLEINAGNVTRQCGATVNERMEYLLKNFSTIVSGGFDSILTRECPVKSASYLGMIKAVVAFSETVRGFMMLFQKDRVRLLKDSVFQVLLLRLISLKAKESGDYLFNPNVQRFPMDSTPKLCSDHVSDFVQRFRLLKLDERQTGLLTALVMCQTEINCNSAAPFDMSQANLVKMLQDKLWMSLQKSFFGANSIDMTVLIQNVFSILADLKRLHELHEQRLKLVSYHGQMPPVASVAAPKRDSAVEGLSSSGRGGLARDDVSGMPALRKALASPPLKPLGFSNSSASSSASSSARHDENGSRQSVKDLHPTVSSLLSAKPACPMKPPVLTKMGDPQEDDQPLNLCVKDKQ